MKPAAIVECIAEAPTPLLLPHERRGKLLGRIPMVVRMNLDLCGLTFSLEDWVQLDLERKIALASCVAEDTENRRSWTGRVLDWIPSACTSHADAQEMSALSSCLPPSRIDLQLQALGLPPLTQCRWSGMSKLERYALLKLTRKGHQNREFELLARQLIAVVELADQLECQR